MVITSLVHIAEILHHKIIMHVLLDALRHQCALKERFINNKYRIFSADKLILCYLDGFTNITLKFLWCHFITSGIYWLQMLMSHINHGLEIIHC